VAEALVIGVDAGGTHTRALLADEDGGILGDGRAGPANARSGALDPAAALETALRQALGGREPDAIAAGCIGIAGAGTTRSLWARDAARRAWTAAGFRGEPRVTDDVTVAFAAGTVEADGAVLVAGTGAIAAAIDDRRVTRRADGYGWLLGDAGSAVWLGLHAVRAALAGLDGRGPPTALTEAVARELAPGVPLDRLPAAVLEAVDARTPGELGELAPLVSRAARDKDVAARALVDRAAGHLVATLAAVAGGQPPAIVLSGGLLINPGPVAERVHAAVRSRYTLVPAIATSGAAGAAALALAGLPAGHDPAAHARLLSARKPDPS
jgi:glucosamine kinase